MIRRGKEAPTLTFAGPDRPGGSGAGGIIAA
jgi:hypothetical protein